MKTQFESVHETRTAQIAVNLIAAERRPLPNHRKDADEYQPEEVHLTYRLSNGHSTVSAKILGPVVSKKTGDLTRRIHDESLWSDRDWPKWITDIVDEHRPDWHQFEVKA